MCIVRDFEDEKFQIHQNGKLVYSFGDCRTIPANETCLNRGWKYSSKYRYAYHRVMDRIHCYYYKNVNLVS